MTWDESKNTWMKNAAATKANYSNMFKCDFYTESSIAVFRSVESKVSGLVLVDNLKIIIYGCPVIDGSENFFTILSLS